MKIMVIDPPEGWKYGFPKPYPIHLLGSWPHDSWFLENGYPQRLIDQGMLKYCRRWEAESE